jgi:hypothetical protein
LRILGLQFAGNLGGCFTNELDQMD